MPAVPHAEDFCGLACASANTCRIAYLAIDGDEKLGVTDSYPELEKALDALETCRRYGCDAHKGESDARIRLQTLVDEGNELDALHEGETRHAAE